MPHYEIELRDPPAGPTYWTYVSEEWFLSGHEFELEGRMVQVVLRAPAEQPFDERLVVVPA